jgi:hypothetical protein
LPPDPNSLFSMTLNTTKDFAPDTIGDGNKIKGKL